MDDLDFMKQDLDIEDMLGLDLEEQNSDVEDMSDLDLEEQDPDVDTTFDLDIIEEDWKTNCTCLSDKEILEIYKQEDVTTGVYYKELNELRESLPNVSGDDRILAAIFNRQEELERIRKMDQENWEKIEAKMRDRRYLSADSQKRVVEGTMDVVFHATRSWHKAFEGHVPMEEIYYVCVRALLNATKYCLHYSTKKCFRAYVRESIRRAITKFMAQREHISYRNAYYIIYELYTIYGFNPEYNDFFEYEYYNAMQVESPSAIYERIRHLTYEEDYVGIIDSSLFMQEYSSELARMKPGWERVMRLLYDAEGHRIRTIKEVSEILGKPPETIEKVKRKAIGILRENKKLNMFRW